MSVTIELPQDLADRLEGVARAEGQEASEYACALLRRELAPGGGRVSEPTAAWQSRLDSLLARVDSGIPAEVSPEEIEAEIRAAKQEVRAARAARRQDGASSG